MHAIIYGGGRIDANSDNDSEGDLATSASSNSNIYMVAGSVDAGSVGVGATVSVLTWDIAARREGLPGAGEISL